LFLSTDKGETVIFFSREGTPGEEDKKRRNEEEKKARKLEHRANGNDFSGVKR